MNPNTNANMMNPTNHQMSSHNGHVTNSMGGQVNQQHQQQQQAAAAQALHSQYAIITQEQFTALMSVRK